MKNPRVSVIIPNWNGYDLLQDCLESLNKQILKDFEIVIVDNASTDNSVEYVKQNFPKVKIIELKKNYGFARAINEGVRVSNSKYLVFLNNDTAVDPEWLQNLVQTADNHPEVSSVGSKILNFFNRKIIDGVGISMNEVGQAKSLGWQEIDRGQYNKEQYVLGVTGAASLFRRDIFIKVGYFDENYFMYSEEVDWAFRAQFLGYKSIYNPLAVVYHKHKMSSKKLPQNLEYWQFKNMTQTIIKDMPAGVMLKRWRWLKIILVHINTIFYQIRNGFIWPPIFTEIWLITHMGQLLLKRWKIQSTKKVSDEYIESFLADKKLKIPLLGRY